MSHSVTVTLSVDHWEQATVARAPITMRATTQGTDIDWRLLNIKGLGIIFNANYIVIRIVNFDSINRDEDKLKFSMNLNYAGKSWEVKSVPGQSSRTGWQGSGNNSLEWRHNERHGVSNHQPHDCLLNRWFRRRSKQTSKVLFTGLWAGISPQKGLVTRKVFPFDDVIMYQLWHAMNARGFWKNDLHASSYFYSINTDYDVLFCWAFSKAKTMPIT